MVITGIGKKPLNSVEEAEAYKRLKAYGYEVKEIAKRVGKSLPHIYNLLKIADLPQEVKKRIINDEISGNTVLQIFKDAKTADDLIAAVDNAVNAANEVDELPTEETPTEGEPTEGESTSTPKPT